MSPHTWVPTGENAARCTVCGTRRRLVRAPLGSRLRFHRTEYLAPRAGQWSMHPVACRSTEGLPQNTVERPTLPATREATASRLAEVLASRGSTPEQIAAALGNMGKGRAA